MSNHIYDPKFPGTGVAFHQDDQGNLIGQYYTSLDGEPFWLTFFETSPKFGGIWVLNKAVGAAQTRWGTLRVMPADAKGVSAVFVTPEVGIKRIYSMIPVLPGAIVTTPGAPPKPEPEQVVKLEKIGVTGKPQELPAPIGGEVPMYRNRLKKAVKVGVYDITAVKGSLSILQAHAEKKGNAVIEGIKQFDTIPEGQTRRVALFIGPITDKVNDWDTIQYTISAQGVGDLINPHVQILPAET